MKTFNSVKWDADADNNTFQELFQKKKKKSKLIGKAKNKLKRTSDININKRISKFTNKINLKSDDTINLINTPPNKIKKEKEREKYKTSNSIGISHLSDGFGSVKKLKNKNNHDSLLTDPLDTPDSNIKKVKKRKQKLKKLQTDIDKTVGPNVHTEVDNLLKTPTTTRKNLHKNKTSRNNESENSINKEKSNDNQKKQLKKYKKELQQEMPTAANNNILTKSKKRRMRKLKILMNKDKFSEKNNAGSVVESRLKKKVTQNELLVDVQSTNLKERNKKNKMKGNNMELLKTIPEGTKKLKTEFEKQFKKIKINKKVQSPKENLIATETPSRIIRDKKREKFFEKLKDVLKEVKEKKPELSLRQKMMDKLKAARFRFINEQIYTTDSKEAQKLFQDDPSAFKAYHNGYRKQVKSWPLNPLDAIIQSIKKMPKTHIVVDFGCGDARLSKSVNQKVHSFDLVAVDDTVIECDMSKVPLENSSVDIAVFCLSLMGTNLRDYLLEANRILKVGGILKIAEVESRFENIDDFVKGVGYFGFKNTVKDLTNNLFYFLDFKKERPVKHKNKLPTIGLLPCLYKKR